MPSDCQCSACACGTKIVTKVISSKEATRRLAKLEEEVEQLKEENGELKRKLRKATTGETSSNRIISKKQIIKDLKDHLDRI